jgi:membrane associated rhomboid family serine protease
MTETGRGVRERLKLSNLPITVGVIAFVGGFFVRVGFHTYPEGLSTFPYLLDPFFYFGTIFTHSGASHYVANMYFLVPAGIILTYLTSNREVLGVVLVSHLPTAVRRTASWLLFWYAQRGSVQRSTRVRCVLRPR